MTISPTAREAAERIARMTGDPLCERAIPEVIQAAMDEAVERAGPTIGETRQDMHDAIEADLRCR